MNFYCFQFPYREARQNNGQLTKNRKEVPKLKMKYDCEI